MLGVFIDTIVICSATAAIILSSGVLDQPVANISGIDMTQRALSAAAGSWGSPFVAIAIFFFAFTSIIANYAYAESNLLFLEHNHPAGLLIFRCAALGMVMFGALAELPVVWKMADTSMALMAITNLTAILLLSRVALKLANDYHRQRTLGKLPTFDANRFPELKSQLEPGVWDKN
jgi:AGCS family alanine or glycine:cation symporter